MTFDRRAKRGGGLRTVAIGMVRRRDPLVDLEYCDAIPRQLELREPLEDVLRRASAAQRERRAAARSVFFEIARQQLGAPCRDGVRVRQNLDRELGVQILRHVQINSSASAGPQLPGS